MGESNFSGLRDNTHMFLIILKKGTGWGENGYIRLARNANNLCNVAMFPVYPIL